MEKGKFVTKQGIECPNCGYLNQECKEHYAKCGNCQTEYEEPVATVLCSDGVIKQLFEKQIKKLEKEMGHQVDSQNHRKAAMFEDRLVGVVSILTKLNIEGIAL